MTTTIDAVYQDGMLKLDESMDLGAGTRVRVRIEIPEMAGPEPPGREPVAGRGDLAEARSRLRDRDRRILEMSPEARSLFEEIRTLRDKIPPVDFDIVESIREFRDHG
jgi:predicted DNA-binding antitoxin AbrB/MazE fold protein